MQIQSPTIPLRAFLLLISMIWAQTVVAQAELVPVQAPSPLTSQATVVMRDGVEISVRIFNPPVSSSYPTLYVASPYPLAEEGTFPNTPTTSDVAWLATLGYNVVIANVRGTGESGGNFEFLGRESQQDQYELIEWIAAQPWSNGQVAGMGAAYAGTMQWLMAIQNPPHLSCIAPVNGTLDPYTDWAMRGGTPNRQFLQWYEEEIRDSHAFPASGLPRYIDFDMRLQQLMHPTMDNWWLERASLTNMADIQVPVMIFGSWLSELKSLATTLGNLDKLPPDTRVYIGSTDALLQDRDFLSSVLLPYYGWCFNSREPAAHPQLPTLRYKLADVDDDRSSNDWPTGLTRFTPLYPGASTNGNDTDYHLELRQQNGSSNSSWGEGASGDMLTFTTPPLAEDLELTGPLMFEFYASSSANDVIFNVELFEEETRLQISASNPALPTFTNPTVTPSLLTAAADTLVSTGTLKASMRTLANNSVRNYQPVYAFGNLAKLNPGRTYRFDLALQPVARVIRAGNRLKLRISSSRDASTNRAASSEAIFHNGQFTSRLWLPVQAPPGNQPIVFAPETPTTNTLQFPPIPVIPDQPSGEPDTSNPAARLFDSTNPVILIP